MKHHYIPRFYLQKWAIRNGELCQYRQYAPGKISPNRKAPDGTGYEVDLYRIDGLPDELAHRVEKEFMHVLDTRASLIHEKMANASGPIKLENIDFDIWTSFLLSLRARNPEAVKTIKEGIIGIYNESETRLKESYPERRSEGDPETYEEFIAIHGARRNSETAMNFLRRLINNQRLGPTIQNFHWNVLFIGENSKHTLLTSDRPILMPYGLKYADSFIGVPLGPRKLFVAAKDIRIIRNLLGMRGNELVGMSNEFTVKQARSYVWGIDDSQLSFVRKYMSAWPDPTEIRRDVLRNANLNQAISQAVRQGKI